MTELEKAQFASEMLNGLAPLFTGSFLLGLLVGVFFLGRLADFIDRFSYRFRKPRRIRFGDFEYLYLFNDKYYSLAEYEKLKKEFSLNRGK